MKLVLSRPAYLATAMLRGSFPVGLLLLLFAGLLLPATAEALPRWSLSYQQDCHLCHNDPSGGGMRSLYASQFIVPGELAARWLEFEELEELPSPQVNEQLSLGADFRLLYRGGDTVTGELQNFFNMQAMLYTHLQLSDRTALQIDLLENGSDGGRAGRAYGIFHILPQNGYIKAGRFVPAYGWRRDDHTAVTRQNLALRPFEPDTGIEFGIFPAWGSVQAGIGNGRPGEAIDRDDQLAFTGRAEFRQAAGPVSLSVGMSGRRLGQDDVWHWGPFGGLQWGPLTYVGEFSRLSTPGGLDEVESILHSHEVAWRLRQGVELLGLFDFFDPDLNSQSGLIQRFGLGAEVFLNRWMNLRAVAEWHDDEAGPAVRTTEGARGQLVLQLLY